jgi:hypothetical protein
VSLVGSYVPGPGGSRSRARRICDSYAMRSAAEAGVTGLLITVDAVLKPLLVAVAGGGPIGAAFGLAVIRCPWRDSFA